MMKLFSLAALMFFSILGCNGKEINKADEELPKPEKLKSYAGKNRVKLTWHIPSNTDAKLVKCRIYWNEGKDSLDVTNDAEAENQYTIIDNLTEGVHAFAIASLDIAGHISGKSWTSGTAYGEDYAASITNRAINAISYDDMQKTVHIDWGTRYAGMIGSEVRYLDALGKTRSSFVAPDENNSTLDAYDRSGDSLFSYHSFFLPEPSAIDTFKTLSDTVKVPKGKILWDGDASKGYDIWKVPENIEGEGNITVVHDPIYGETWKFYKPAGSHRTESHGAKGFQAEEGDIIYIGWRFKVDMSEQTSTNAVFQWKAYGNNMKQNFPEVLKHVNGAFTFLYQNPDYNSEYPWDVPTVVNKWISIVLKMKISRIEDQGYVELWYNGEKQTFDNGSTRFYARTLDAEHCDPKWGIYGGDDVVITNYVTDLKIATSYELAAPK